MVCNISLYVAALSYWHTPHTLRMISTCSWTASDILNSQIWRYLECISLSAAAQEGQTTILPLPFLFTTVRLQQMDRQKGRQFGHQAVLLSTTHWSGLRRDSLGGWEVKVRGQGRNKWRRRSCKLCFGRLVLICVCVCIQQIHLHRVSRLCV